MEYICIDKDWKKATTASEAVKLLEYQIATNLMSVHNSLSDIRFDKPSEVVSFISYAKVRDENKEAIRPFVLLNFNLWEISHRYEESLSLSDEEKLAELSKIDEVLFKEIARL